MSHYRHSHSHLEHILRLEVCGVVRVVALRHLEGQDQPQVEVGIPGARVQAVAAEVLVDVLRRGLTEDPVAVLSRIVKTDRIPNIFGF